jgi:hypothetical protein
VHNRRRGQHRDARATGSAAPAAPQQSGVTGRFNEECRDNHWRQGFVAQRRRSLWRATVAQWLRCVLQRGAARGVFGVDWCIVSARSSPGRRRRNDGAPHGAMSERTTKGRQRQTDALPGFGLRRMIIRIH